MKINDGKRIYIKTAEDIDLLYNIVTNKKQLQN